MSYEDVGEILRLIEQLDYDEVAVEFGDVKIHAVRHTTGSAIADARPPEPGSEEDGGGWAAPLPAPVEEPADRHTAGSASAADEGPVEGAVAITAPMVGTFYRAPGPDEDPFVTEGDQVTSGQQVGIIEVMKLMSAVVSDTDGLVRRIDAANAELVEYGQALMWIEPTS